MTKEQILRIIDSILSEIERDISKEPNPLVFIKLHGGLAYLSNLKTVIEKGQSA